MLGRTKSGVAAAVQVVQQRRWPTSPSVAIILGTGLGQLSQQISVEAAIPYAEIPGFLPTTAVGHRGQLVCGTLSNMPLLVLDGRWHLYEGYTAQQVTFPIRVVRDCGATTLVVTNAGGGLDPSLACGDVVVIEDHINLMGPLRVRPPDAATRMRPTRGAPTPYDDRLMQQALELSRRHNLVAHRGVYAAVRGPNYETRAEYRFLRRIGADVVGMSTVPEVLVAHELEMRVLGLSIVTNVARPDAPEVVDALHVLAAAQRAEPHVQMILESVLASLRH